MSIEGTCMHAGATESKFRKCGFQIWKPNTNCVVLQHPVPLKLTVCLYSKPGHGEELDDVLPRGKQARLESVELPLNQKAVLRED